MQIEAALTRLKKIKHYSVRTGTILRYQGPVVLGQKIVNHFTAQTIDQDEIYQQWLAQNCPSQSQLARQRRAQQTWARRPLISIILPVYNVAPRYLQACLDSVLAQTYPNWELCVADDASTNPEIKQLLTSYRRRDSRIKITYRKTNGHISAASNSALKLATGSYAALLDHDDYLWPNALYEIVRLINRAPQLQFIYTDEDKIDLAGHHLEPHFKPDFCWDSFLSNNYLCHLSVLKMDRLKKSGGFRRGFEGSQDYDLFLRFLTQLPTSKITHLPKVLYSWRKVPGSTAAAYDAKGYANMAAQRALTDYLQQNQLAATVTNGLTPGSFRINYQIIGQPLVSIIIPTKNAYHYLRRCLRSIDQKTTYANYEVIIADTGSDDPRVSSLYQRLKNKTNYRLLTWQKPFNYAAVNNWAAKQARGDYLLLLNNDTTVISGDWIQSLLQFAQQPLVGAVGAKLLYPDKAIQHAGVILGVHGGLMKKGVAGHIFAHLSDYQSAYFNWKDQIHNYSAVTAACLMINKKKYWQVGGIDESFQVAFNDVDFNLKLLQQGYRNVYTPYAKLYHCESVSVGYPFSKKRAMNNFWREVAQMRKKWGKLLDHDPCYNANFSRGDSNCTPLVTKE